TAGSARTGVVDTALTAGPGRAPVAAIAGRADVVLHDPAPDQRDRSGGEDAAASAGEASGGAEAVAAVAPRPTEGRPAAARAAGARTAAPSARARDVRAHGASDQGKPRVAGRDPAAVAAVRAGCALRAATVRDDPAGAARGAVAPASARTCAVAGDDAVDERERSGSADPTAGLPDPAGPAVAVAARDTGRAVRPRRRVRPGGAIGSPAASDGDPPDRHDRAVRDVEDAVDVRRVDHCARRAGAAKDDPPADVQVPARVRVLVGARDEQRVAA